ncbi:hypothetical protein P7H19_15985 [Paenibacillus larvae]|nr:hypothetical protein [Paenibacillus larvae]MDT2237470.1 hypothetical protein [Paenibacillus larvae]
MNKEMAILKNPREPRIPARAMRKIKKARENMFEAAGYTYDQAYLTLEAINDSLLFSSRFVSVRNRPEELLKDAKYTR